MTAQVRISGWLMPGDVARANQIARSIKGHEARIKEIAADVANHTGISTIDILTNRRRFPQHARARWLVWSVAHREGMGVSEIARVFGCDHTTVSHGIRRDAEERAQA